MDPVKLQQLKDEAEMIAYGGVPDAKNRKKHFDNNMAANSEGFKQLGNLHREKRVTEYFPQDERDLFGPKPQNMVDRPGSEL